MVFFRILVKSRRRKLAGRARATMYGHEECSLRYRFSTGQKAVHDEVPRIFAEIPLFAEFLGRLVARVRELPPHVGLGIVVLAPLGVGMAVSGIVRLVRWASGG